MRFRVDVFCDSCTMCAIYHAIETFQEKCTKHWKCLVFRFAINIQTGPALRPCDDVNLHLSVRPSEHVIVRNHMERQNWGAEERYGGCPIAYGSQFEILILAESDKFKIAINGTHFCEFVHRLALHRAQFVHITGDGLNCQSILVEGDAPNVAPAYHPMMPAYGGSTTAPPPPYAPPYAGIQSQPYAPPSEFLLSGRSFDSLQQISTFRFQTGPTVPTPEDHLMVRLGHNHHTRYFWKKNFVRVFPILRYFFRLLQTHSIARHQLKIINHSGAVMSVFFTLLWLISFRLTCACAHLKINILFHFALYQHKITFREHD